MGILNIFKSKKLVTTEDTSATDNTEKGLAPLEDPFLIPKNIDDFKPWHYKVLRRLNKHPVKEPFSGKMTIEVTIPEFIVAAEQMELIAVASYNDALRYLKNDTLKQILKQQGLKVSGNKDELVKRILSNIREADVRKLDEYSDFYVLTDEGKKIVNESYDKIEEKNYGFFKQAINLIMQKEFDAAYKMACKRNAEMPAPPGINCNWSSWYKRGITDDWLLNSAELMEKTNDPLISASAIYSLYSSDSYRSIAYMLIDIFSLPMQVDEASENIKYEHSKLSINTNLSAYQNAMIKNYRFLATLDERTCPICGKLDGKIFAISEKQLGVNCPPMHKGCRCTIVSAMELDRSNNSTRYARDSTGRGIKVPSTMNWSEWRSQYMDKDSF
uniref:minor capsid protein n=1 Tax=Faecalicatena contorta TaxID=39482 RepID=UPI00291D2BF2|nr:minor head protein [uncultured phage]